MKKIIAAMDGLKFSESTMQYTVLMGIQNDAHIVGVFLDDITYSSRGIYQLYEHKSDAFESIQQLSEKDRHERNESVERFEKACQQANLNYSVHRNVGVALAELLHESVYADLLILDANESFTRYTESPPTHFISELLDKVACPVLLVPKTYTPVRQTILLYDGEPVSVFAIKMFNYLLPVMNQLPSEMLTVNHIGAGHHVPDDKLIKEFMKRHHPSIIYKVIQGQPELEIPDYIRQKGKEILVVLGAYQRGFVSRYFRPSMADILVQELQWPLFIAHNK